MEIHIQHDFDHSAAEVWRVVGEGFADLTWSSLVTRSSLDPKVTDGLGVGSVRVCESKPIPVFNDSGEVRETLLAFDPALMRLAYRADLGAGKPAAMNRWQVVSTGVDACRIDMHASVELKGWMRLATPFVRGVSRRLGRKTLRELQAHLDRA